MAAKAKITTYKDYQTSSLILLVHRRSRQLHHHQRLPLPDVVRYLCFLICILVPATISVQPVDAVTVDVPYQNWTVSTSCVVLPPPPSSSSSSLSSTISSCSPSVPELFRVATHQTTTTKTTTSSGSTSSAGCYRIQKPKHEIIMRIHEEDVEPEDNDNDDGDDLYLSEQYQRRQLQQKDQQLLVIELPNYIVKNRQSLNVDVDYETGLVIVDGYGYISRTGGLRGERNTGAPTTNPSSPSKLSSSSTGGRKYCLHQEFAIDESMLSPSSSSSSSVSIWDMTMEMNWSDRKLTLALPVTIPIPHPEDEEEKTLIDGTSQSFSLVASDNPSDDNEEDDHMLRHLAHPTNGHTMLRSRNPGKVASKLCGLARLSRSEKVYSTPCTTGKQKSETNSDKDMTARGTEHNTTTTTTTEDKTVSRNTDESTSGKNPSSSAENSTQQLHVMWKHDSDENQREGDDEDLITMKDDGDGESSSHDRRRFNLSLHDRIQSRHDALERFLEFSLGRNDEESYWLRRM